MKRYTCSMEAAKCIDYMYSLVDIACFIIIPFTYMLDGRSCHVRLMFILSADHKCTIDRVSVIYLTS